MKNVFKFIKANKKNVHICNFNNVLGKYYSKYISPYRGKNNEVNIYLRKECLCGKTYDYLIHSQSFKHYDTIGIEDYIKKVEATGLESAFTFKLRLADKKN